MVRVVLVQCGVRLSSKAAQQNVQFCRRCWDGASPSCCCFRLLRMQEDKIAKVLPVSFVLHLIDWIGGAAAANMDCDCDHCFLCDARMRLCEANGKVRAGVLAWSAAVESALFVTNQMDYDRTRNADRVCCGGLVALSLPDSDSLHQVRVPLVLMCYLLMLLLFLACSDERSVFLAC
jgi:hypothetical protein